ncbi:hypothetical protein GCM10007108_04770 [Thermogymnomonas acidicola]|uniref:RNA polymerase Rpb4 n=1 Tax=Thermogymnomonas acidicola TaxID=399579 RepID=A0AA37F9J4_9ARCH|nr:hypothetical protein [Thermogymnomonas acidicola]GGM69730.1 hypothetical protein GCM10007108_04770 [Thermogymnomonas acidicola]
MRIRYRTIAETYEILHSKQSHSDPEKDSLAYCESFLKLKPEEARKAVKYIQEEFRVPEKVAVKLVDLKPVSRDELVAVLSSYGVMLDENNLSKMLDYFLGL